MAKAKKKAVASPKTENPVKQMQWCWSKHIYVTWEPEAVLEKGYYRQLNSYKIVIRHGDKVKDSGYIYTGDNIIDAVNDAYREIYKRNYNGTKTKK